AVAVLDVREHVAGGVVVLDDGVLHVRRGLHRLDGGDLALAGVALVQARGGELRGARRERVRLGLDAVLDVDRDEAVASSSTSATTSWPPTSAQYRSSSIATVGSTSDRKRW